MTFQHPPKEDWGPGPWQDEPDSLDWTHSGFPCRLVRNDFGSWCGYVGVPDSHPFHQKGHSQCVATSPCSDPDCSHHLDDLLSVHGGVTYVGPMDSDDLWWIGFDCGHAWDKAPGMDALLFKIEINTGQINPFRDRAREAERRLPDIWRSTYKTLSFAQHETEQLAEQLSLIGGMNGTA